MKKEGATIHWGFYLAVLSHMLLEWNLARSRCDIWRLPTNCLSVFDHFVGLALSSWCDINTSVPQGSILCPLLSDIFINDLFFSVKKSDVRNFADDNSLFCGDKSLDLVFLNFNNDLSNVMDWFKINSLKFNPGKFQFMVLGASKNDCFNLNVTGKIIPPSSEVTWNYIWLWLKIQKIYKWTL